MERLSEHQDRCSDTIERNGNRFLFLCVYISPCTGNIYKYMEIFSPNYKLIMW